MRSLKRLVGRCSSLLGHMPLFGFFKRFDRIVSDPQGSQRRSGTASSRSYLKDNLLNIRAQRLLDINVRTDTGRGQLLFPWGN